ncbi:BLUF domain-containing protein [Sphingomonas gellani]|uniref:BLUF domain-containing protein n=1 Tax=Sphingomonas gellani TaxID=1166340 RepID=UPI000B81A3C7|nr:BLUF domain-containing protein [Sphingomonas gellani]
MLQIAYTSRAAGSFGEADYNSLIGQARSNNERDGLTGLILFDGSRFLQAIEGPKASTSHCMARIASDGRHHDIDIVKQGDIRDRDFANF